MDNKCLLIINPISGTTNKRGLDKRVARRLESLGLEIETAWTTARGDATLSLPPEATAPSTRPHAHCAAPTCASA